MKKFLLFLAVLSAVYIYGCKDAIAKDIKVMVMDTGIDGTHPYLVPYVTGKEGFDWTDEVGHGTHIAGIIAVSKCDRLKITSCRFTTSGKQSSDNKVVACLKKAYDEHFDIVNYSAGGSDFIKEEDEWIGKLNEHGTKVIVAAGNEGLDLSTPCKNFWPACSKHPNVQVIGALGRDGNPWHSNTYAKDPITNKPVEVHNASSYGREGMLWGVGEKINSTWPGNRYMEMSGTSMATALYTLHLVKKKCSEE